MRHWYFTNKEANLKIIMQFLVRGYYKSEKN